MRFLSVLGAALFSCGGLAASEARAASTRQTRPLTIAVAGNVILPSVGLEVGHQVMDRLALSIQVTQLLIAHVDASARMRVFILAGETSGIYLGANGHAWYSPLIFHGINPVGTLEAGYEHRAQDGFTFGIGLGAGILWNLHRDGGGRAVEPVGMLNVRLGKSF